jgi:hypothetical protein
MESIQNIGNFLRQLNSVTYYALIVIAIIIGIGLLSKWSESDRTYSKHFVKSIEYLMKQTTQWNTLAKQDTNPILQLIHCNYALAYAQVIRYIASDKDIENITGIDIHELIYYLDECQTYTIKNINQQCPKIKTEGNY